MSVRHVERMNALQEQYSAQANEALANGNINEAIGLVIVNGVYVNKKIERTNHEQNQDIAEARRKKVDDYASTFEGFGKNQGSALTLMQVAASFGGQAAGMAAQSVKGLNDEGKQAVKTIAQHDIDEHKRIQDDIKSAKQKSQETISAAMQALKQLHSAEHDTKTQMLR